MNDLSTATTGDASVRPLAPPVVPVALPVEVGLKLSAKRCALILIDLQQDFLSPDGAYGRAGALSMGAQQLPARILPLAQSLKRQGGYVAASLFTLWPGASGEPIISPHLKKLRPFLAQGDFAPGSPGQALMPDLTPWVDVQVCKVAYSAFFNTQLDWILRKNAIDTLIIGGIVTNGGVASTARDAHMRDYQVLVLEDGCAAFSEEAHQASLRDLRTVAQVLGCEQALHAFA
jgi:ureidoacrylate peracid hydrolase